MARSGRARCWLPTDSTRAISPSATVLPFTSIDAEMSSLPGFPPEIETTTRSSCILAARSAIAAPGELPARPLRDQSPRRLHSARHDMTVSDHLDRMGPPAQSILWRLRFEPRNQAHDLAGADVKRANQRRPFWRKRPGLRCLAETGEPRSCVAPLFRRRFLLLERVSARLGGTWCKPDVTRSGSLKSMSDIAEVSFCIAFQVRKPVKACATSVSGKRTSRPLRQPQIPPALPDHHGGEQLVANGRMAIDQGEQLLGPLIRAKTDNKRQLDKAARLIGFKKGAVVGDDDNASPALP